MCDTAPLAGKSGITDAFSGVFELSTALPCACLCMFNVFSWLSSPSSWSACRLEHPVGESGGSGSIGPILTSLCVPPAIFACTVSPCASIPMFVRISIILLFPNFRNVSKRLQDPLGYLRIEGKPRKCEQQGPETQESKWSGRSLTSIEALLSRGQSKEERLAQW